MSVKSWLSARQKDGQRIGFLKTGEGTLRDMLKPLRCAILSLPPEYGFALPSMVELLWWWNLYADTDLRNHYDEYILLKDVLRHPRRKDVGHHLKVQYGPFLNNALGRIIHRQSLAKEGWSIFELMQLQEALADSQLLIVQVQPHDQSCHFRFVGPARAKKLFILQEGHHFHGIKEPSLFFVKYCHLH